MRGLAAAALVAASPAIADAPDLLWPLDCGPEAGCFIQRYTDIEPGSGATDYACGTLTGDGHNGTDFALPSLAAMEEGVSVTAAAAGTVRNVRDAMPDISVDDPDAPPLEGRDCGNGVVVAHGDGWETQYCHLKRGSVQVAPGDAVAAGEALGSVGLSGNTSFPHVHLSVRKDGRGVDPFDPEGDPACGADPESALWQTPIPYRPGGLIAAGFADEVPGYDAIRAGRAGRTDLDPDAAALVVWAYVFGGLKGDEIELAIDGPEGGIITERVLLEKTQPQLFRAVGRRTPEAGWPAGRYTGRIILRRDGEEIDRRQTFVRIGG